MASWLPAVPPPSASWPRAQVLALPGRLSPVARVKAWVAAHSGILAQWERARERFVKVMPRDYKRALEEQAEAAAITEGAHHG